MRLSDIALLELGEKDQPIFDVKYNTWFYGKRVSGWAYPWCVTFVLWCLNKMGVDISYLPQTASVTTLLNFLSINNFYFLKRDFRPSKDDIMFLDGHICIVYEVTEDLITTIDGNYDNKVSLVTRKFNDNAILGYGKLRLEEVKTWER